jgi:hypothetical protein
MSGAASVPLVFCAIYFPNVPLKVLFIVLAVFSVVGACYQVWRDSVSKLQAAVAARDAEIERLKHRDYDEEHKRLAESKVNVLSEMSKDLVCFLLHYGENEADELRKRCRHEPEFNDAVQRAREAGLVVDRQTGNAGQSTLRYFWKINPEFKVVLQDLLGRRKTTYF